MPGDPHRGRFGKLRIRPRAGGRDFAERYPILSLHWPGLPDADDLVLVDDHHVADVVELAIETAAT